jgi:hypothetical protein
MNLDTITVDMDVMDKTTVVMTLMVRGSIPRGPTTLSLPCHIYLRVAGLSQSRWYEFWTSRSPP